MIATEPAVLNPWGSDALQSLTAELTMVRARALDMESHFDQYIQAAHPRFRESARNLLHYLGLRNFDLRDLQTRLASLGLSSLGRTESHTLPTLNAVMYVLRTLSADTPNLVPPQPDDFTLGDTLLKEHTEALLGPHPDRRGVRIMVTLPSEAASDASLIRELIASGMDCARINCAHDDATVWARMIANIHAACRELGRECRIQMDLSGPKLRTGPLEPGPEVVHIRPRRDARGAIVAPAQVWLTARGTDDNGSGACEGLELPVDALWLARLQAGNRIRFVDARGKRRSLRVLSTRPGGCLTECSESAYVETGTLLALKGDAGKRQGGKNTTSAVGELPALVQPLVLLRGETLVLLRPPALGASAVRAGDGTVMEPAHIACTLPDVFRDVRVGEAVALDDGRISGLVQSVSADAIQLKITQVPMRGGRLGADKGINFPESRLQAEALTPKDLADLHFAVRHADIIGLSFVREAKDVYAVQAELERRGAAHIGILLKIETRRGFEQLPWLMLAAMRSHPVGIIIARGDLAVECGWERMAEVQEEILWLCEAAHLPVVWATQVLEGLAKTGQPSRAEITDAAMSERAECVMLNKGSYIRQAILSLVDILERMQTHQTKKMPMLRRLEISDILNN